MRSVMLGTLLFSVLLIGATPKGAVVPQSIEEMAVKAQQIVIRDVIEITSYWGARHTS